MEDVFAGHVRERNDDLRLNGPGGDRSCLSSHDRMRPARSGHGRAPGTGWDGCGSDDGNSPIRHQISEVPPRTVALTWVGERGSPLIVQRRMMPRSPCLHWNVRVVTASARWMGMVARASGIVAVSGSRVPIANCITFEVDPDQNSLASVTFVPTGYPLKSIITSNRSAGAISIAATYAEIGRDSGSAGTRRQRSCEHLLLEDRGFGG